MTTQQTWAKDKYDEAKKSSTKVGWKHDDLKFDVAATNDKYSVKVASPLVKDDWKVDGSLAYEEKPTKSCKVTAEVGAESPDMGGVVAAVGVSTTKPAIIPGNTLVREFACNYIFQHKM